MSNDLVVQLGAKLDQFASDMNQAGDMAGLPVALAQTNIVYEYYS